jgi:hypothetical protein
MYGTYNVQIGGTTVCKAYDQIITKGSVTLSGELNISFIDGFLPKAGQSFTIINNEGKSPINGTFADLPEGTIFIVDDTPFSITYRGGDGNSVVLTALVKDAYLTALSNKSSNTKTPVKSNSIVSMIKRNAAKILITLIATLIVVVGIILLILKTTYKKPNPPTMSDIINPNQPVGMAPKP